MTKREQKAQDKKRYMSAALQVPLGTRKEIVELHKLGILNKTQIAKQLQDSGRKKVSGADILQATVSAVLLYSGFRSNAPKTKRSKKRVRKSRAKVRKIPVAAAPVSAIPPEYNAEILPESGGFDVDAFFMKIALSGRFTVSQVKWFAENLG